MSDNNEYSMYDVEKLLRLPYERLRQWREWGFIPSGTRVPFRGGEKTVWTGLEVGEILAFKVLVEMGFRRKVAKELIEKHS